MSLRPSCGNCRFESESTKECGSCMVALSNWEPSDSYIAEISTTSVRPGFSVILESLPDLRISRGDVLEVGSGFAVVHSLLRRGGNGELFKISLSSRGRLGQVLKKTFALRSVRVPARIETVEAALAYAETV